MEPVELVQRLLTDERPRLPDDLDLLLVRKQVLIFDLLPVADAELHHRGLQEGGLVLAPSDALAVVPEAVRLCRVLLLF